MSGPQTGIYYIAAEDGPVGPLEGAAPPIPISTTTEKYAWGVTLNPDQSYTLVSDPKGPQYFIQDDYAEVLVDSKEALNPPTWSIRLQKVVDDVKLYTIQLSNQSGVWTLRYPEGGPQVNKLVFLDPLSSDPQEEQLWHFTTDPGAK